MITQDLLNYIKQQIAAGKNYDYIVDSLKSVGWSDNDINEAFRLLNVVNYSNNNPNNNHYYNQNLNLNTNNLNSTYLDNRNKLSISLIISIIFVVLSLFLFVVSIILSFFNLIQNNIILYIISCLTPLFAFIGLILSIITLKKNKVISIINIIFSVIILLIQLVSFVIGFFTGFNQALNQARNDNDLISSNDDSLIPTPTNTVSNQTPTKIPTTPTPSPTSTSSPTPHFVTQKDKADFIKNIVTAVKKNVNLPQKINEFLTWKDVIGTDYSIRYIYDAEAASTGEFSRDLDNGFKDLVCNDSRVVNEILSKDITIEYLINFKLDSKQKLLMARKSDCN